MQKDDAACGDLSESLLQLARGLDSYLEFANADAQQALEKWKPQLTRELPEAGVGLESVLDELNRYVIPYGSAIPKPGCTSFITTGATTVGALTTLAGAVAAPQRNGMHAFHYLEQLSLEWLAELLEIPSDYQGVYSSGGSVANLVALGAARQHAFERVGINPSKQGVDRPTRVYASEVSHRVIHRSVAVLGMGMESAIPIGCDEIGRMRPDALEAQIKADVTRGLLPVAVVATAGTTSMGVIDPMEQLDQIAEKFGCWFHVDGAYGLPGILDPSVRPQYEGMQRADSFVVDPHKWLGAPVGIGATYVRDGELLHRAFSQGESDYLEGSCDDENVQSSMDSLGTPYYDFGVELSAPSRGAVVWALIREIGREGMRNRVVRHNAMAKQIAKRAKQHPNLELLQEPTLSICCFRYVDSGVADLDELNRQIHRALVRHGENIPSTAVVDGKLAIRPCFVGARTEWAHADALVDEVLEIGAGISCS